MAFIIVRFVMGYANFKLAAALNKHQIYYAGSSSTPGLSLGTKNLITKACDTNVALLCLITEYLIL